MSMLAQETDR